MRRRAIAEQDRALLDHVRAAVLEVEPSARIILYGSRAHGDAEPVAGHAGKSPDA